jgi:hypothetical protein
VFDSFHSSLRGLILTGACVVSLSASYLVWACSPEAEFIKGKFVWAHWDVEELRKVLEEEEDKQFLTLAVAGIPYLSL